MMKKILSIVLAVALCLTAMVGCLTVSADGAATATVATVEVDAGTATADVAITIAGDAIAATYIDVALPELALVGVASATDGLNAMHNSVNAEGVEDFTVADAANAIRILLDSAEGIVDYTSLSVVLTFNTANAAAGEYAVTVTGSDAADSNEAAVVVSPVAGAVVVKEVVSEPVLDANIVITPAINIDATLGVIYMITGVADTYADFDLTISADRIDPNQGFKYDARTTVFTKEQLAGSSSMYYVVYDGLGMFELNVPLTATINCYDEAGNKVAYSNANTTSMKEVAVSLYNAVSAVKTKTLLTDLLNLGAEAQTYFASMNAGSDLANIALPNEGFDQTYASAELGELTELAGNAAVAHYLDLAINPGLLYMFSVANAGEVTAELTYYDWVNKADRTTTANVVAAGGNSFYFQYTDIALSAAAQTVTATIYNDGVAVLTDEYCLESVIKASLGSSRTDAIYTAVAKFGKSAKAYFEK